MRHFGHNGPLWRGLSSPPVSRIEATQRRIVSSVPALLIGILAAVSVIVLMLLPPISQNQDYHQFADQRTVLGIPNFWNVVSNLPFIAVGALGLMEFYQKPVTFVLFSGFLLTGFGSSYYHWNPSDETLFWDRLPMTLCFMAILAHAIEERIDARVGALLLWPLLGVGLLSLLLWRWTGDLRLYVWVQFFPCLALPILFLMTPAKYTGLKYWIIAAVLYALAKVFELYDREVYSATVVISGHTLKHFAAAGACFAVLRYFQTRRPMWVGGDHRGAQASP
jgi:Ceramidase